MSINGTRMDSAQIRAFLAEPRHAIAAVLRPDGSPQLSPVWFLYEDERLYFSTGIDSAKYRQLDRDPRVALCIDAGHPDARAVTIYGATEFIAESDPRRADLEWKIWRRYLDSDEAARLWAAEVAAAGPSALISVTPDRIVGLDYN